MPSCHFPTFAVGCFAVEISTVRISPDEPHNKVRALDRAADLYLSEGRHALAERLAYRACYLRMSAEAGQ